MSDSDIIENFQKMVSENPEIVEQFKNIEAQQLTQASILLKGGLEKLGISRITPKDVEIYLLAHPVIPRGIEIKANRITGRGYKILPRTNSDKAKQARDRMDELLAISGGEILLNSWIKDAYGFGNGYITLLPSDDNKQEIVYISKEHPMFFRIAREKIKDEEKTSGFVFDKRSNSDFIDAYGSMKIDPVTKKPLAYTQVVFADDSETQVKPIGKELDKSQVAHLVFDAWGDEAEGVGVVQYVNLVLKYLMNIEEAGAQAIYRSGFSQKKVTTKINSEKDLKKLADNLAKINASDSIILPEGTDVQNLVPGTTEFDSTHEIFLNLIAIRLGIPKPILTLDGSNTNKATMRELMRDLLWDLHADELKIKKTVEEQIFEPACRSIFGEDFKEYPIFEFKEFEETQEEKATVLGLTADYVKKLTETNKILMETKQEDAAKTVLDYMLKTIPKDNLLEDDSKKSSEPVNEPKVE